MRSKPRTRSADAGSTGRTTGRVDALVTEGHSRASLAGVRALGDAGLRVLTTGPTRGAAACWSRGTTVRALCPLPDKPGFVERVGELAAEYGPLVVHGSQEEALEPLTRAMDRLPPEAIVPYPGPEPLDLLRDKAGLAALGARVGLIAPSTLAEGPAGTVAADPPSGPCVVKSTGVSLAIPAARTTDTPGELAALLKSLPPEEPVVVQERLEGPLVGFALVLDREGRIVAQLQQVARRLYPSVAGAMSLGVSVAPDRELGERCRALLLDTGFWGLAQLDFIDSPRGPALIDVNPRYYGSLPLARAAGVNFAAAWQAVALGERLPAPGPYREGVVYRWLEGDVQAALHGSRGHLRPPRPRASSGAVWAADDPVPSALSSAVTAWAPFKRRLRDRFGPG